MSLVGFERSMPVVLTLEGGYSNNPHDPGGATFQGVTQRAYDAARVMNNLPKKDVRQMAAQERNAIYQHFYWDAVFGDVLPLGIDLAMFDSAVNSGPVRAIMWLQETMSLGGRYAGAIDGHFGPVTSGALSQVQDYQGLLDTLMDRRLAFLEHLPTWVHFGGGWAARVHTIRSTARHWMTSDKPSPHQVVFVGGGHVKTPLAVLA